MTNLVNPYRFGVGAFSPAGVSGLLLWLDATDLTTLWQESTRDNQVTTDGQEVGAWDDKSGNGNHWTQATATKLPLYKEDFNTSYPSVWFDGFNDNLVGSMSESANDWTVLIVTDSDALEGYVLDWQFGRFVIGINGDDFGFHDGVWSTGTRPGSPSVVTLRLDSSTSTSGTVELNRIETVAADYTQKAMASNQALGSRYTADNDFWEGWISSILIYEGNLSDPDIASVEDYLADRYGITF